MSEIDYQLLEKSIERLKDQYTNFCLDKKELSPIDKEAIKESVIKRFDVCFDTLLKHLKKFMEDNLGMPEMYDSPVVIIRNAGKSGAIEPEMHEQLNEYKKIRNSSAHNYSEEEATKTINIVEGFIVDVSDIYQSLVDS